MNCKSLAGKTFLLLYNLISVILSSQYLGYFFVLKLDVLIQFGSEFDVISDGCLCYSRQP